MITKVKQLAKRDLEGKVLYAVIAMLVIYLINSAAMSVPQYIMMPSFMQEIESYAYLDPYAMEEAFVHFLTLIIPMFAFMIVISIVMSIFVNSVLQLGYVRFSLNLSTTGDKSIEAVFEGFKGGLYLKRVKVMFFVGLYMFLWMLPLIAIQGLLFTFMGFDDSVAFLSIIIMIGYMFFYYSKVLNYAFVPYLLMDEAFNYETAGEYIEHSKQLIEGKKWTVVGLAFSFILWFLLVPFTLGLILFYVYPYMIQSFTRFYLELKEEKTSLYY